MQIGVEFYDESSKLAHFFIFFPTWRGQAKVKKNLDNSFFLGNTYFKHTVFTSKRFLAFYSRYFSKLTPLMRHT